MEQELYVLLFVMDMALIMLSSLIAFRWQVGSGLSPYNIVSGK
jgi:hypothetical protein